MMLSLPPLKVLLMVRPAGEEKSIAVENLVAGAEASLRLIASQATTFGTLASNDAPLAGSCIFCVL